MCRFFSACLFENLLDTSTYQTTIFYIEYQISFHLFMWLLGKEIYRVIHLCCRSVGGKKEKKSDRMTKKKKKGFLSKGRQSRLYHVSWFFFYFVCSCMYVYNIQVQMIDFEMEINQIYRTKSFCLCVCVWLYCFVVVVIQFILSHLWFSFFSSIDWFYFLVCEQKKIYWFQIKSNRESVLMMKIQDI